MNKDLEGCRRVAGVIFIILITIYLLDFSLEPNCILLAECLIKNLGTDSFESMYLTLLNKNTPTTAPSPDPENQMYQMTMHCSTVKPCQTLLLP